MKNVLIGICECSDADTDLLVQYLKNAEAALMINFEIHTYSTGKDLLNNYRPVYDILFITVPVVDADAEVFVSQLRQQDSLVRIVLISESCDFFGLGYEYNVNNYFIKPLWYSKILNELKKSLSNESILNRPYLWLFNQQGYFKLYLHKIRYIETSNRLLKFHYGDELFFHNGKLSVFEHKLADSSFFRCNNSYIVNVNYIEKIVKDINRYSIYLVTGEIIPLSRNKKRELAEILETLLKLRT